MKPLLVLLVALMMTTPAWGRTITTAVEMPYLQTDPADPEDLNKVLMFFSYTCPFCAQYDAQFYRWGNNFPRQLQFEAVPVVYDKEEIPMARGYYAAKKTDPVKIAIFNAHVFYMIHSKGRDFREYEIYEEAAKKAGLRVNEFREQWDSTDTMLAIMNAHQRLKHYRPRVTPTLVIKGQYITDPDRVNGDYGMLFQLATGILSRILDGSIESQDWFQEVMKEIEEEASRGK